MLNRIRVKNFKSFKNLDYSCAELNLLVGVNGAGKSSFVQLLLFLKAISGRGLNNAIIRAKEIGLVGNFADLKYCYAKDSEDVEVGVDFSARQVLREGDDGRRSLSLHFLRKKKETVELVLRPCNGNSIRVMHPLLRDKILNSPEYIDLVNFYNKYGGIDTVEKRFTEYMLGVGSEDAVSVSDEMHRKRNAFNVLLKKVEEEIKVDLADKPALLEEIWNNTKMVYAFRIKPGEVHDSTDADEYDSSQFDPEGNDAVEFLYKFGHKYKLRHNNPMRHRSSETKGESFLIDEVNAWLGEISPGARIDVESVSVGDAEKYVESVSFGDGGLRRTFKPQNVGFGISYILPVLVTLLTTQPEDIVIIENPEAHLHPRGQSEMGRLIAYAAARGVQLFVETHSDHVINGVRVAIKEGVIKPDDAKVAFFERSKHLIPSEDGKGSVEVYTSERDILIDKNGALSEYPTDFLDEWNNQLIELM